MTGDATAAVSAAPVRSAWSLAATARQGLRRQGWMVAAVACLVTALVLPPITVPRQAQSFFVVFDITQSMGVTDMKGVSASSGIVVDEGRAVTRLEASKAAMRQVLRKLPCGSQVAWGVFTDYRSIPLVAPLEVCAHFDALLSTLDLVEPRMRWANASNVARGVYWALRATQALSAVPASASASASASNPTSSATAGQTAETPTAAVDQPIITIFFSDGQEAPPVPLDLDDLLRLPTKLPGLLVGVGTELASPIPRTDEEGRVIATWQADEVVQRTDVPTGSSHEELSAMNESHLRAIAAKHGLAYTRLRGADALHAAMLDAGPSRTVPQPTDVRWMPALAALACMVLPYVLALVSRARRRA